MPDDPQERLVNLGEEAQEFARRFGGIEMMKWQGVVLAAHLYPSEREEMTRRVMARGVSPARHRSRLRCPAVARGHPGLQPGRPPDAHRLPPPSARPPQEEPPMKYHAMTWVAEAFRADMGDQVCKDYLTQNARDALVAEEPDAVLGEPSFEWLPAVRIESIGEDGEPFTYVGPATWPIRDDEREGWFLRLAAPTMVDGAERLET